MNENWLPRALEESRARGFLGPQPIELQIVHAQGFIQCWELFRATPPLSLLDLGSGGGLPGLVLLERWPRMRATLLDSMTKRAEFLREVLAWSDAPGECAVVNARAEEAAWWPEMDGAFDLVTARSFGPPAVTAECAARFMRIGGLLIVSEPPTATESDRWNERGLAVLGLRSVQSVRVDAAFHVVEKTEPTPRQYPRPTGIPKKRPLF